MTLDAQGRGVFSLDITATDQALPNNIRKSSTVRVSQKFFAFSRKELLQTKLNGPLILVSWFGYCLVNFFWSIFFGQFAIFSLLGPKYIRRLFLLFFSVHNHGFCSGLARKNTRMYMSTAYLVTEKEITINVA